MESSTPGVTAPDISQNDADTPPRSPEQEAADQALARAARPPESVTPLPPVAPATPSPPLTEPPTEDEPSLHRTGHAARLAATRHEGDAVLAVEDEYAESRDAVLAGSKDEVDLEAVTEWLLSDAADANSRKLTVRVAGSDEKPILVDWYIHAIGIDVIRSAEREASGNRQQRRGQPNYDELAANLRIVAEGTHCIVAPGERADAEQSIKKLSARLGFRDPVTWLQRKFAFRPGAIAQIAGEIMALSGFDQSDVQAAGN